MLYMIEMQIHAGQREKAVEAFETRGPNRHLGVTFRGAWIGTRADTVYALIEATDEAAIDQAAHSWSEYCQLAIQPVINIENY